MRFEFSTAGRIVFGSGTIREVSPLAAGFGRKALVVTGADSGRASELVGMLQKDGLSPEIFPCAGEPTVASVAEGAGRALDAGTDVIIGFGGGSALDAGKAIATLATNGCDPLRFLEVIGRGEPLVATPQPFIAVPTTAGTGSEVTRNAVIGSPLHGVKASMRSPLMLPKVAVVDPELTLTLPPEQTANTGLDALAQLVEPFVSKRANPFVDSICREGMRLVARSLRMAFESGGCIEAREDMAMASMLGGMALANAGLGAVHGIAAPLGGMTGAPHGALCARLLPFVMGANISSLRRGKQGQPGLERFAEVALILSGRGGAAPEDGVRCVFSLCEDLGVGPLGQFGLKREDIGAVAAKAVHSSSMKGNPVELSEEQVAAIIVEAL